MVTITGAGMVSFDQMTDDQAMQYARLVERAVHHDPDRHLHQPITPFASAFDLMGGLPPARWRLWARARWRDRLFQRVHAELCQQREFARGLLRHEALLAGCRSVE